MLTHNYNGILVHNKVREFFQTHKSTTNTRRKMFEAFTRTDLIETLAPKSEIFQRQ